MSNKKQQTEELINAVAYREFINKSIRKASERIRGSVKITIERVRKTRADITRKPDYQIREKSIKTESKSLNDDLNRLLSTTKKLAEQVNVIKIQHEQQRRVERQRKSYFSMGM